MHYFYKKYFLIALVVGTYDTKNVLFFSIVIMAYVIGSSQSMQSTTKNFSYRK